VAESGDSEGWLNPAAGSRLIVDLDGQTHVEEEVIVLP
jgi:hypothetical protein